MTKEKLKFAIDNWNTKIKTVLQVLFDALDDKRAVEVLKNKTVKELFDRYGVRYSEAIDPAEFGRTYIETDELIEEGEV